MNYKTVFGVEIRTESSESNPTTAVLSFSRLGYEFSGSVVPQTSCDARDVRYSVIGYWPSGEFESCRFRRNQPGEVLFNVENHRSIASIEAGLKFAKRLFRRYKSKNPPTTFGAQVALIADLVGVEVIVVHFNDGMDRTIYRQDADLERGLNATPSLRTRSVNGGGWDDQRIIDLRTVDKDGVGDTIDRFIDRGIQNARSVLFPRGASSESRNASEA